VSLQVARTPDGLMAVVVVVVMMMMMMMMVMMMCINFIFNSTN